MKYNNGLFFPLEANSKGVKTSSAMKKIIYLFFILTIGLVAACKKDKNPGNNGKTTIDPNLLKDSVYYYEKEDYLWFDAIPSYASFNPRGHSGSSTFNALTNELAAISQLKINP